MTVYERPRPPSHHAIDGDVYYYEAKRIETAEIDAVSRPYFERVGVKSHANNQRTHGMKTDILAMVQTYYSSCLRGTS